MFIFHSIRTHMFTYKQMKNFRFLVTHPIMCLTLMRKKTKLLEDIDGSVQKRHNSSALSMNLRLSCTNPWICDHGHNCSFNLYFLKFKYVTKFGGYDYLFRIIFSIKHWLQSNLVNKVKIRHANVEYKLEFYHRLFINNVIFFHRTPYLICIHLYPCKG